MEGTLRIMSNGANRMAKEKLLPVKLGMFLGTGLYASLISIIGMHFLPSAPSAWCVKIAKK